MRSLFGPASITNQPTFSLAAKSMPGRSPAVLDTVPYLDTILGREAINGLIKAVVILHSWKKAKNLHAGKPMNVYNIIAHH